MKKKVVENFLMLRNCISEKNYRNLISLPVWNELDKKTRAVAGVRCQGCGFEPYNTYLSEKQLFVHVIEENLADPLETKTALLCNACHSTQHIEFSINSGWIKSLINSSWNQGAIISAQRSDSLIKMINSGVIKELQKTPQEFLEEFKNSIISYDERLKIIFNLEKFNFEANF